MSEKEELLGADLTEHRVRHTQVRIKMLRFNWRYLDNYIS